MRLSIVLNSLRAWGSSDSEFSLDQVTLVLLYRQEKRANIERSICRLLKRAVRLISHILCGLVGELRSHRKKTAPD